MRIIVILVMIISSGFKIQGFEEADIDKICRVIINTKEIFLEIEQLGDINSNSIYLMIPEGISTGPGLQSSFCNGYDQCIFLKYKAVLFSERKTWVVLEFISRKENILRVKFEEVDLDSTEEKSKVYLDIDLVNMNCVIANEQ